MSDIKRFDADAAVKLVQFAYEDSLERLKQERDSIIKQVAQAAEAIKALPELPDTLTAQAIEIHVCDIELAPFGHPNDCKCECCYPYLRRAALEFVNRGEWRLVNNEQAWAEAQRTRYSPGKYRAILFILPVKS